MKGTYMSWKIKAITGPFAGQEISIDRPMVVGRDPSVDLVLQGGHISRKHAELSLRENELWVKDLNSSNGTYVNGQRISEQALKSGDELQIDVVRFLVQQAVAAQAVARTNSKAGPVAVVVIIFAIILAMLTWHFFM
jgi:pSer/pThr/pTyr-binding forkhead associated (FHA) protein